jgi:hypothetical protein
MLKVRQILTHAAGSHAPSALNLLLIASLGLATLTPGYLLLARSALTRDPFLYVVAHARPREPLRLTALLASPLVEPTFSPNSPVQSL